MRVPEQLRLEMEGAEAAIREAFCPATRHGGTSWSEAERIDFYEKDERKLRAAREKDRELCWEELVDDPSWRHDAGVGGFNFLDPIGFRYYIAPAMIRCIRDGGGENISHVLGVDDAFKQKLVSLLNEPQSRAVARFVRLMIAMHEAAEDDIYGKWWVKAYQGYWGRWE